MRWRDITTCCGLLLLAAAPAPPMGGTQDAAVPGPIDISQPWTTAAGANGDVTLFMTLINSGMVRDDLVRASCPVATSMEIEAPGPSDANPTGGGAHQVAGVPLFGGQTVVMGPQGYRIVLHGLKQEIVPRAMLPCTVFLQRSGERLIEVSVLPAGSTGPEAVR